MSTITEINGIDIHEFGIAVCYNEKRKFSPSWQYFGHLFLKNNKKKKVLNDLVFCVSCLTSEQNKYSEGRTWQSAYIKYYKKQMVKTTTLLHHLQYEHNIILQSAKRNMKLLEADHASKSKSLEVPHRVSCVKNPLKSTINKELLAKRLALWFCKSLLPFDYVADDGMICFFKECGLIESCADLPSQDDISGTALDKIYELTLKNIKTQIVSDNPLRISRHSNIWIDYFRQQIYLTNSIHYLTADFELKSFTLKTQVVDERQYTEVNERINKEFGLHYKDTTRYNCLGYAFHCLVIDDGIKKTPETFKLVQKCKSIILEVSRYITELQTETPQQKQLLASFGIIAEIIKRDSNDLFICDLPSNHRTFLTNNVSKACETTSSIPLRWHINLKMLESIKCCGSSSTINKVLETIKRDVLQIVPDEWNLLENLIQFLSKFQLVVEILSSEKSCTINLVLLIKTMIKEVLMEENSLDLRSLKDNMLKNLDDKFLTRRIDVAAALLDSRFIELKEVSAYLQNKTRVTFLAEFIKEIHDELQNIPSKQKSAKIKSRRLSYVSEISRKYNMFDDPHCATYEEIKREVRKYFEVVNPAELDNANLLDYWKSKKNTFPWLSYLARAILCIPAINIPCERMLTMAGQQFTTKRSRLSPHSLDKVIFVHENYAYVKTE